MTLWLVRLAWASLPVTAGPAAGDALDGWSTPPRTLAEVFLWSAWVATLVAVLAPRPIGLTVVRVVAPSFVALAVVVLAGGSADAAAAVVALVATAVAAAFAARSVHSLSGRWVVLVPAGLVIVDPLTLPDPVLFLRERIEALQVVQRRERVSDEVLDVRLGARGGSVAMRLDRPVEFLQTRRGLRGSRPSHATELCFATVDTPDLLVTAASRRIRVA